ncbi:VanZ family protein [uncultured Endozoicomonas sp.]|uniref:VanZ family protein n=1 Tax=uncultured Endozoicomonas sp. TaxID=432652 RepID=UPI002633BF6C|nr:VanZ family protein [uncultured Endozoicomonas sp.]
METVFADLQALPDLARICLLLVAIAFALFMALIPHRYDPSRFINDKVKHAITFMVLFALLDLAWPSANIVWWKPVSLFVLGIGIEVCQGFTKHRYFSFGDLLANGAGIMIYLGWCMMEGTG